MTVAVPLTRERWRPRSSALGSRISRALGCTRFRRNSSALLGIPLTRGRLIDRRDGAKARHVAVVNEEFVRRYIAGEDPLGKRIAMGLGGWAAGDEMAEIVGVVGDVKYRAAENEVTPQVYVAHAQRAQSSMMLVVRTVGNPSMFVSAIRGAGRGS